MSCLCISFIIFCNVFFIFGINVGIVMSVFASAVPTVLAEGRTRNERRGGRGGLNVNLG